MPPFKLIATDVDGTLLRSDRTPSPRTLAALDAAVAAGVRVVFVSGRQVNGLRWVARDTGVHDLVIASNGAVGFDLGRDELIFVDELSVGAQLHLVREVSRAVPGAVFAAVRDLGRTFVTSPGYRGLMSWNDHFRKPDEAIEVPLDELAGEPSIKMIVRHPTLSTEVVYAAIAELDLPSVHPTTSGAPFVEVSAAGVNKATGVAHLCAHLGIEPHEVAAFGDQRNDLSMLAWAGHGVAMGNALPEVKAEAARVTESNDDDGFAIEVERLLAQAPVTSQALPRERQ